MSNEKTRKEIGKNPISKSCFVVGPIDSEGSDVRKHADFLLHGIIAETTNQMNMEIDVKRADFDDHPGMITDRIINDIHDCDIVIADLTFLNPNVFYELGIRPAAQKPTVHIATLSTLLPFDNLGHRTIFFDSSNWESIMDARKRLRKQIEEAFEPDFEVSNPVTHALTGSTFLAGANTEAKIISDIVCRVSSIERKLLSADFPSHNQVEITPLQHAMNKHNFKTKSGIEDMLAKFEEKNSQRFSRIQ
jgi:nucleoside 2-deoxyribosyltransferase